MLFPFVFSFVLGGLKTPFLQISMNFDHPQNNLHIHTQVQTERRRKKTAEKYKEFNTPCTMSVHLFSFHLFIICLFIFKCICASARQQHQSNGKHLSFCKNRRKRMKVRKKRQSGNTFSVKYNLISTLFIRQRENYFNFLFCFCFLWFPNATQITTLSFYGNYTGCRVRALCICFMCPN